MHQQVAGRSTSGRTGVKVVYKSADGPVVTSKELELRDRIRKTISRLYRYYYEKALQGGRHKTFPKGYTPSRKDSKGGSDPPSER